MEPFNLSRYFTSAAFVGNKTPASLVVQDAGTLQRGGNKWRLNSHRVDCSFYLLTYAACGELLLV